MANVAESEYQGHTLSMSNANKNGSKGSGQAIFVQSNLVVIFFQPAGHIHVHMIDFVRV